MPVDINPRLVHSTAAAVLRQPVGEPCVSPRPFARVVGGCAGAVREVRLTRPSEPVERQGGGGQAFFCLHDGSPAAPGGEDGVEFPGLPV